VRPFNELLSMHRNKIDLNEQILTIGWQIEEDFIYPVTVAECSQMLRAAAIELRKIVRDHHTHRHNDRANQIVALNATGIPSDRAKAKVLSQIHKAESVSAVYRKIKTQMKSARTQSITRVEVPANPADNPKTCTDWKVVDVPSEVLYALQERNRRHFGQAHGTPFTVDPLVGTFGYTGNTLASRQVLNGNFDLTSVEDPSAATILKHMRISPDQQARPIQSVIDIDSFRSKLKSWRESTTTSPSGMHLGHYRAMPTSDTTGSVHASSPANQLCSIPRILVQAMAASRQQHAVERDWQFQDSPHARHTHL
jgi:ribosomal silencing factor RsfS